MPRLVTVYRFTHWHTIFLRISGPLWVTASDCEVVWTPYSLVCWYSKSPTHAWLCVRYCMLLPRSQEVSHDFIMWFQNSSRLDLLSLHCYGLELQVPIFFSPNTFECRWWVSTREQNLKCHRKSSSNLNNYGTFIFRIGNLSNKIDVDLPSIRLPVLYSAVFGKIW